MGKRKPELIGEQLRRAIIDSGLTAYRISQDTGVAVDSIQRFLNGERDLRLQTVEVVAGYLGLQLTPKGE